MDFFLLLRNNSMCMVHGVVVVLYRLLVLLQLTLQMYKLGYLIQVPQKFLFHYRHEGDSICLYFVQRK